jgi:hypothetical protein
MKRLKAWLLRWLGAVSIFEFETLRAADKQQLRDGYCAALSELKADYEKALSEVIQELNDLRNSMPVAVQSNSRPVRVFRNFREFRTVVETRPKPIRIERTTS